MKLGEQNKPIIEVVKFIQKGLKQFRKEFKDSDVKNENGLTYVG